MTTEMNMVIYKHTLQAEMITMAPESHWRVLQTTRLILLKDKIRCSSGVFSQSHNKAKHKGSKL